MGISYDMDEPLTNTVGATATTAPQLSYEPMSKEWTSGNVNPMPQRKVILFQSNVQIPLHNT